MGSMRGIIARTFSKKRYEQYKKLIEDRNEEKFPSYTIVGFAFSAASFLFSFYDGGAAMHLLGGVFMLFFMLLHIFYGKVKKLFRTNDGTVLMRHFLDIVLLITVLLGTVCMIPDKQTYIFFLALIIFPIFVVDYPITILKRISIALITYVLADYFWKTPEIFQLDIEHAIIAYLVGISFYLYNVEGSCREMDGILSAKYESEHHVLTGLRNKYGLQSSLSDYTEVSISVMMMDLDNFKFFNDMYGHQMGDDVISAFGNVLKETFGEDNCYSYGGDEFLIVLREHDKAKFQKMMSQVRRELDKLVINGIALHPSFSCGCAYGWNQDEKTFANFITYADILLYQVKAMKKGSFRVVEYDGGEESLAKIQKELNHISRATLTDALTELPNMDFFRIRAESFLKNAADYEKGPAFAYFNISNLKAFNEQNGFYEGDNLIRFVATTLKQCFPDDLIARFAEDHFVILTYMEGLEEKMKQARDAVREKTQNSNVDLKAGVYPHQKGVKIDTACDYAKIACDSLKKQFEVYLRVYDNTLDQQNKATQYVVSHFERALREEWIKVYYQPIAMAMTGKICVMEALSRWDDPEYGIMAPGQFIPILEEHKLIRKLDLYMIEAVMKEEKMREEAGLGHLPITVNISRNDFENFDIADYVSKLADKYNYNRKKMVIEITESALTVNVGFLKKQIQAFRESGFPVWLDDYGSGYSSLNTLREFDFDRIKLDMMFMKNYHGDFKSRVIIERTISMASQLGISTLMEGVETEEQLSLLNEIGCELAQGYLISKPQPLSSLVEMIENKSIITESEEEIEYYKTFSSIDLRNPGFDSLDEEIQQKMQGIPTAIVEILNNDITVRRMNVLYRKIIDRISSEDNVDQKNGIFVIHSESGEVAEHESLYSVEKDDWVMLHDSATIQNATANIMSRRLGHNPVTGADAYFMMITSFEKAE